MIELGQLRHSLRTPLNQIIGYSEMLADDAAGESAPALTDALRDVLEAARDVLLAIQRNLGPSRESVSKAEWRTLRRETSEPIQRILAHVSNLIDHEKIEAPDLERIRSAANSLNQVFDEPLSMIAHAEMNGNDPAEHEEHSATRLLIVDDDEANRDVLSRQLERLGYTTHAVDTGEKVLQQLAGAQFDMLLLDIVMPGMSGFDVLSAMKADGSLQRVSVIVISAMDEMQSVARCIEMGADDFISKPFDRVILKSRIEAVLKRRKAEQERAQLADRLKLLLESTGEGIFGLDAEGKCVFINGAATKMLGFDRKQALGGFLHDLVHTRQPDGTPVPADRCPLYRAARYGEATRVSDVLFYNAEGESFPVDFTANPIVSDGKFDGAVIVFSDIRERKLTEEKLRQTAKLESLGVLAGGVAHDFNNLLTGIMGNTSLLLNSPDLSDGMRERLDQVVNASERAADLTRQMLAYAGKGRYIKSAVDVSELVTETRGLLSTLIPKTVHIMLDLADPIAAIYADRIQIQQVIMNLVINAGEAIGEPNPGSITVRTFEIDVGPEHMALSAPGDLNPGQHVVIDVIDSGPGMTPAVRARIFDPFFTTKFTGRGLGLAAVLGIVRGHKGVIQVQTAPGNGSRFRVLIPATAEVAVRAVKAEAQAAIKGSGRILIVDDEAVVRRTTDAVLRHSGFNTVLAESGDEAVELLRDSAQDVAVVLLDMMMPGMGGDEAFSKMREIRPGLPIIISSGYGESQVMKYFEGRDIAGFIQKPYTSTSLIGAIQNAAFGQSDRDAG